MKTLFAAVVTASFIGGFDAGADGLGLYLLTHPLHPRDAEVAVREPEPPKLLHEMQSAAEPEQEAVRSSSFIARRPAFDEADARAKLADAASMVGFCRVQGSTRGAGAAFVIFETTGEVAAVGLDDPYKSSTLADCLKRRFRPVHVAPFDGRPRALGVRFTL